LKSHSLFWLEKGHTKKKEFFFSSNKLKIRKVSKKNLGEGVVTNVGRVSIFNYTRWAGYQQKKS
jgi:hypothetical protein